MDVTQDAQILKASEIKLNDFVSIEGHVWEVFRLSTFYNNGKIIAGLVRYDENNVEIIGEATWKIDDNVVVKFNYIDDNE